MLAKLKSRRGVTIAELLVTLALVSIIGVMVSSFVMLINQRTRANTANDTLRQDRQLVEAGVESWVKAAIDDGAVFSCSEGSVYADINIGDGTTKYNLSHSDDKLIGHLPNGDDIEIRTQNVKDVTFDIMTNTESGDFLLFCTVVSEIEDFGGETIYTFCVNPHEGESGGT